eukprot:Partr_v1_DN27415_c1_g1_i2_m72048 putative Ral GEF with PH domain and SH3 binding motif
MTCMTQLLSLARASAQRSITTDYAERNPQRLLVSEQTSTHLRHLQTCLTAIQLMIGCGGKSTLDLETAPSSPPNSSTSHNGLSKFRDGLPSFLLTTPTASELPSMDSINSSNRSSTASSIHISSATSTQRHHSIRKSEGDNHSIVTLHPSAFISANADLSLLVSRHLFTSPQVEPALTDASDHQSTRRIPTIPTSPLILEQTLLFDALRACRERLAHAQLSQSTFDEYQATRQLSDKVASIKSRLSHISAQILYASAAGGKGFVGLHSDRLAFAITLIDWSIFIKIHPSRDLLHHNPPRSQSPQIQASMDFFNYLTRSIENSILECTDNGSRAQMLNSFIKVANRLYELRNYNSLKAVVSALSTKAICKLRKCWDLIPKKSHVAFDHFCTLMSENDNFERYREALARKLVPSVPFLGVLIHDITYLTAARAGLPLAGDVIHSSDSKVGDVLEVLRYYQSGPDYLSSDKYADCTSKHHSVSNSAFKKEFEDCLSERHGFACDLLYCSHFVLSRVYVSDSAIDSYGQTVVISDSSDFDTASLHSSRSSSPKKILVFDYEEGSSRKGIKNSMMQVFDSKRRGRSNTTSEVNRQSLVQELKLFDGHTIGDRSGRVLHDRSITDAELVVETE